MNTDQLDDKLQYIESKDPKEILWSLCGFCGCFDAQLLEEMWMIFLRVCEAEYISEIERQTQIPYKTIHLWLNIFDAAGLTEHGTAVRGSWVNWKIRQPLLQKLQIPDLETYF